MIIDIREHGGVFGGGKYRIGSLLKYNFELKDAPGGMGNEVWSKTDVGSNVMGIAVDSAGNVYVTHSVASGSKAVRKLDANGNEIWSKTDVSYGQSVAVDNAGYVYLGDNKAARKLDSNGNEIWSNTDAGAIYSIAVDSAGYVYTGHYLVSTGSKAVRKLDGNKYYQIVG